jgi:DNA-binding XRE family transcriptional regulator
MASDESRLVEPYRSSRVPLLRLFRVAAGLSQGQLALRAGVARETVVRIEGERGAPTLRTAHALAGALGTQVDAVFPATNEHDPAGEPGRAETARRCRRETG